MRSIVRFLFAGLLVLAIPSVPILYATQQERHFKNFRIVESGVLYRSGQLTPEGLKRVIHDHGIKTVISLRFRPHPNGQIPDQWEEDLCNGIGIRHIRIRPEAFSVAGSDEVPARKPLQEFLKIARDPNRHPILIHCNAGMHRTGAFCAVYRMDVQGWRNEDAIAEMEAIGYDNLDNETDVRDFLWSYRPSVVP
ncbi:MAG: tyrosine-protein phosphatase [Gemmataceae bacterium]|nr:tyrosine-protein phosphatase [Gemmataceae bacterium]